ncbi:Putative NAD(P)-binding domain superfamily [Septoria linicola]|uniref:NAD(P)-binding domain superfamily n=1 Tax=Septoria linicola TaxID=215465 RepID=A0A9Q9ARB6_9PEZI|nr:Putative NAD(P)-binding domain superfamily [Septoria linicola]
MTILITGSRGKTASELAAFLSPTRPILIASRNPPANAFHPTVRFDWTDPTTYANPFDNAVSQASPIRAVYLVAPDAANASELVMQFVNVALAKGVKRFVLLSAWTEEKGEGVFGKAHAGLEDLEKRRGIEWAVVRPHFFMENFIESWHLRTTKEQGKTPGKGRSRSFLLTTLRECESLSYDEVASIISEVIGKKIEHVKLNFSDYEAFLVSHGLDSWVANLLAGVDVQVAGGFRAETTNVVRKVTGEAPKTFKRFALENKSVWLS